MRLIENWKLQKKKELAFFVRDIRGYRRVSIDGFIHFSWFFVSHGMRAVDI